MQKDHADNQRGLFLLRTTMRINDFFTTNNNSFLRP